MSFKMGNENNFTKLLKLMGRISSASVITSKQDYWQ